MADDTPAPLVLVTLGDPNGLGPELLCRILARKSRPRIRILIIGPEHCLLHHCQVLGLDQFWTVVPQIDPPDGPVPPDLPAMQAPGIYQYTPSGLSSFLTQPGQATIQGGHAAGASLDAARALLPPAQTGTPAQAEALVTCPLNKAMLQQAGYDFAGHTEFLAHAAGLTSDQVCMHFFGPALRVSLVTTHPALRQVPDLITGERILRKISLTRDLLLTMGQTGPIAVCGLNPHAGEDGHIGHEEQRIIAPAVAKAASWGWNVAGPLAADTVFHRAVQGDFAAIVAMYHDQGLTAFKLLHFHAGIQMTLGLPYVRTSPDHGTGYDLVGRGSASTQSLEAALDMAISLVS